MSSIPNSAMPHAHAEPEARQDESALAQWKSWAGDRLTQAGRIATRYPNVVAAAVATAAATAVVGTASLALRPLLRTRHSVG